MADSDDAQPRATRAVTDAYVKSLQARWAFLGATSTGFSSAEREQLHAQLHSTTLQWYEVLYKHLANRDDMTRYWEDAPLIRKQPKTKPALGCTECNAVYGFDEEIADQRPSPTCPACGVGVVQQTQAYVTDDDGTLEYEWERGLQLLDEYQGRTRTVTRTEGTFQKREVTEEVPVRLAPRVLIRAARHLDAAANDLDLLESVESELPHETLTYEKATGNSAPTDA